MESHMKRIEIYEDNCSSAMKYKLQARNDYDTIELDPVELLQAIKEASMNYEADEYIYKTVFEALKSFVNLKQRPDESLNDFLERHMAAKSVPWAHVGKDFTKMLQADPKHEDAKNKLSSDPQLMTEVKKRVVECFLAYHFMANADPSKCASLMEGFKTQHDMKKNDPNADTTKKYPATLDTAASVFRGHTWDKTYHEKKKKDQRNNKRQPAREQSSPAVQQDCGRDRHTHEH